MSKRPLDENCCPEKKRDRTENEDRLVRRSSKDEKKTLSVQQKCREVIILERRNKEIVIENQPTSSSNRETSILLDQIELMRRRLNEQNDLQVVNAELEKEMANLKKENENMKSGKEENANLMEEVSTLREELKRLQRHVTTLKQQKRKAVAKNEELMANADPTGDAALHAKEKEKMKKKIKELMTENKQLVKEKEKREGRKDEKNGSSKEEYDSLKEQNKKLAKELKKSIEIREKLNATVDESESSNKILTRQLEWYKKGWLTFHEFAREEMNKNEKEENHLGLDSISMPPEHSPLIGPPPFCGPSPSYDIPYYPSPSPVNTPLYNPPPPAIYRASVPRTVAYTSGYGTPFVPPSPAYGTPYLPPPSPAYIAPFHPPLPQSQSLSNTSLYPPPPCPPSRCPSRCPTPSFRPFPLPPRPPPRRLPPHQFRVETEPIKTKNVDDGKKSH